ncbi:MAG TPA: hypothetical protein VHE61_02395 [Opitutaceae bacterium]|nr:hypothetical protein [Opitutaceae bacterium]
MLQWCILNIERRSPNGIAWSYLSLASVTMLSWVPLVWHHVPVADDFAFMELVRDGGLTGYLARCGVWRPLGQYIPTAVLLRSADLVPVLVLGTHIVNTLLFFAVSRRLFDGLKLPFFVALVFGIFPFGYQAQTCMINYNYLLPVTFFLGNVLLLTALRSTRLTTGWVFLASCLLCLGAMLSNECLFFSTIASGLFAWTASSPPSFTASFRGRAILAYAPLLSAGIWVVSYWILKAEGVPKTPAFHAATIVSVYARQYSLLHIFEPWFDPVTRALLFFRWTAVTAAVVAVLAGIFSAALFRLAHVSTPRTESRIDLRRLFLVLSSLLVGGSAIFVIAGGYSLDSRKKYPLLVLMLWMAAWCWRAVRRERGVAWRPFVAATALAVLAGAPTAWLVAGIWKHEVSRYNQLADFIVAWQIEGPVVINGDPNVYKAWPHFSTTLGYRLDDDWVLNLAVQYRGGGAVHVVSPGAPIPFGCTFLKYDASAANWRVAPPSANAVEL